MRRFFGYDKENQVPGALLYWEGPGFYGAGQRWDSARHCYYVVIHRVGIDPEDYDEASRKARMEMLGSPSWADTPEQALAPYKIVAYDEIPELNDERYSEIVVKHLRESFDCLKL
jgi:hypothetical protein